MQQCLHCLELILGTFWQLIPIVFIAAAQLCRMLQVMQLQLVITCWKHANDGLHLHRVPLAVQLTYMTTAVVKERQHLE